MEKRKAEAEKRKTKAEKRKAEAEEHERKHVCKREGRVEEARREREHRHFVELLQMRQDTGLNPDATPTHSHAKASRPKLPSFDEQRDDLPGAFRKIRWMELSDIEHSFDAASDLIYESSLFLCVIKNWPCS